jgi:hypothetical protein
VFWRKLSESFAHLGSGAGLGNGGILIGWILKTSPAGTSFCAPGTSRNIVNVFEELVEGIEI